MSAYGIELALHSLVRWAVLAGLVAVVARSAMGWAKARPWNRVDERAHVALVAAADLQLALGLWLYLVASPITSAFLANPGASMRVPSLRFFGVDHPTAMIFAIAALHVGRVRSRRAGSDPVRHRSVFRWTLAALLLVLAGVPWPFLRVGRPLLRGVSSEAAPGGAAKRVIAGCPPIYPYRCANCHGLTGHGDGLVAASLRPSPRNFSDPSWHKTDDQIASVIRRGGAASGLSPAMPAQPDLTDAEIESLVACVRSFQP
jgi:mono/diheme cytochrome c family protein